jgi:hypothetical protein
MKTKANLLPLLFLLLVSTSIFLSRCSSTALEEESVEGVNLDESNISRSLLATISSFQGDTLAFLTSSPISIGDCSEIPTTRDELKSLRTVTRVLNGTNNAGVSVPGFGGLTLNKGEISYSVYYVEPSVVNCGTVEKVYGLGYSVHLLMKKIKRNVDISKLPAVAASVQLDNGKTQVFYSLQTHGVSGVPLAKFFKPVVNKPFDVEGFGILQSSIDGIHNMLSDPALSSRLRFVPVELEFVKASDLKQ